MTTSANLELQGFIVDEASSAEAALEKLMTTSFDVVFTDIRMPGMTGVELFRALRERGIGTPVVLMTAFHDELLTRRALEDGAFSLLVKPFDVETAIRVVANAARRPVVLVVSPVDDAIVSHLEERGHSTAHAATQEAAIEMVHDRGVDVCILDLDGGLDAMSFAERVRARRPDVALVGVTQAPFASLSPIDTVARKQGDFRELMLAVARARSAPPTPG